jgi:hypothetical protein
MIESSTKAESPGPQRRSDVSDDPAPDQIMQVGLGFWASKTLLSAVEMELHCGLLIIAK